MDTKLPYDKLFRLEQHDPIFVAIKKMMSVEGNDSCRFPPFEIVNIFVQKYKHRTYDLDMENQHALFLRTTPARLPDEIINGIQMSKYEIGGRVNYGALLTDFFNYAAQTMVDSTGHGYVPIVSAALGNMHICESWNDFDETRPIPLGCNSTWLRGIYGHTATSEMYFSNLPLTIHIGNYQINKNRLHPLSNSHYIVDNPNQVEIILIVEVQWEEKPEKKAIKKEPKQGVNLEMKEERSYV